MIYLLGITAIIILVIELRLKLISLYKAKFLGRINYKKKDLLSNTVTKIPITKYRLQTYEFTFRLS